MQLPGMDSAQACLNAGRDPRSEWGSSSRADRKLGARMAPESSRRSARTDGTQTHPTALQPAERVCSCRRRFIRSFESGPSYESTDPGWMRSMRSDLGGMAPAPPASKASHAKPPPDSQLMESRKRSRRAQTDQVVMALREPRGCSNKASASSFVRTSAEEGRKSRNDEMEALQKLQTIHMGLGRHHATTCNRPNSRTLKCHRRVTHFLSSAESSINQHSPRLLLGLSVCCSHRMLPSQFLASQLVLNTLFFFGWVMQAHHELELRVCLRCRCLESFALNVAAKRTSCRFGFVAVADK
jgi:hypothetical protein